MILKTVLIVVSVVTVVLVSIVIAGVVVIGQVIENDPNIRNEIRQWLGAGHESGQDQQDEISSLPASDEGKVVSIVGNSGTNSYNPNPIEIRVSDTVTWINNDSAAHTVTSSNDNGSTFDSDILTQGETFGFTFDSEVQYPYFCTLHPNMVGTVVVTAS